MVNAQIYKYLCDSFDSGTVKFFTCVVKELYSQNDDRVELTLRIGQSTSSPGKGTESELKSTLKSGQKIVDLMRENPSITIAELVLRLGLSRSGINNQIAKLKAAGVIEREGSDKGGYWLVIDKSQCPVPGE